MNAPAVIRLFDTKSQTLNQLVPKTPGHVGIYVCGPTVYNAIHIGNARPFVTFSWLRNYLQAVGYSVTLVVNVTDVNDKIYARALQNGQSSVELAQQMTEQYIADTNQLGLGRPDVEPKVSDTTEEIVAMIGQLIEAGSAYESEGDIYFSVRSDAQYGTLSKRQIEHADQGEGLEGAHRKRDSADFALWKATKDGEDTVWDSPWGLGRPAWHIECSAMGHKHLGSTFEIHGGGSDLLFPHHENEASQTRMAYGHELAQIWMHSNMLMVGEDKMGKSKGNMISLQQALAQWDKDAILYLFASSHYRQPVSLDKDSLTHAENRINRIKEASRHLTQGPSPESFAQYRQNFFDALANDFNTAQATAAVSAWIKAAFKQPKNTVGRDDLALMLSVFGLEHLLHDDKGQTDDQLEQLLEQRELARQDKDWAKADEIRDALAQLGWTVRDGPEGPQLVAL